MTIPGHVDLCAFSDGQGRVWSGDGAGGWSEVASFSTPAPGSFEAFRAGGDVDGDSHPDLVLVAGAVTFVDWIAAIPTSVPGAVTLELSLDGAAEPWQPLATTIANSDRHQWRIPPDTRSATTAVIRYSLTVGSGTVTATTPEPFTILGGDLIFSDGFESGDTSRWSAVVP